MVVLTFTVVDARLTGLGLPVAPSTVPGNPPYTISNSPAYLYPNLTTAAPYNYPNATGTAASPVRNATDSKDTCAGPNGEKGKLRKRLVSMYASSGSPQSSGSLILVAECSIEDHVQPEATPISFSPKANEIHLTDNNLLQQHVTEGDLLGAAPTSTPTVTTPSAEHLGDTLEMDYGPAKPSSARFTSARTFAAADNANDLTDLQMSRLHAALQPTQTNMPILPAQGDQSSSPNSILQGSSSVAPPQISNWNGVSLSTPSPTTLKVSSTDGSSNAALGGGYPTGKPEGAETAKQSNAPDAPEGVPKGTSPSGGSSSKSDQGGSVQPGAGSSNVGSFKADSAPGSSALGSGASGSISSGLGSGSRSSSGLGSITTGSDFPASGSDSPSGSHSSVIPSSGKNPPGSGTALGSTSGNIESSSSGSGSSNSDKSSSTSGTSPDSGPGSSNSGTGPGASPSSPVSASSGSPLNSDFSPGSGSGASNTGSDSVLGPGSNNEGSIPQDSSPPSDSQASRTGSEPSGVSIIAIGSQSYTARQTGSFVVVGSHTITQGAPAVTIGSTPVSVGGNGVLVAGSDTLALNQAAGQTNNIITIGPQSYTAQQAASFFVVGSNTVVKGAPAVTIASVPVSLGANGLLIAGSNTLKLGPLPTEATGSGAAVVVTVGSSSYTVQQAGSSVVLGSNTIAPEAPAITIASEPVSLGMNGLLVVGSNTMTLDSIPTNAAGHNVAGVITIGSAPYSILPTGSPFMVVGSNTISKGAPAVTIASEPISLGTNGILMAGSNTLALGSQATGGPNLVPDAILSQGGPVPTPSGNPASKGGLTSSSGSSSNTTDAKPFNAGGARLWDTVGRWTWTVGAGTVIAIVICGIL